MLELGHLSRRFPITGGKHSLEIRLVRTAPYSEQAERTTDASHEVYRRYQMKIHGDSEEKCGLGNWKSFLVESPLVVCEIFMIWPQNLVLNDKLFVSYLDMFLPGGFVWPEGF